MDFGSVNNNNQNNTPSSQQAEDEKKPLDQHLSLKVKGQDGNEVFFRIKRSTQLRKLMNAYCERQSVDINSIAFLFDGRRLRAEQTPAELEMEEGDEIDAMLHQTGGFTLEWSSCSKYVLAKDALLLLSKHINNSQAQRSVT